MAVDERTSRGSERCSLHPTRSSVARCDACGRSMCLPCAIPVRGGTLGAECLSTALESEVALYEVVAAQPGRRARAFVAVGFAVAVLATVLPWSRFGPGSEPFGAWSRSGSWSMLAAVAAVAGLSLSVGRRFVSGPNPAWDLVFAVAGAFVAAASILAVLRPPAFTSPWLGPWAALLGGVLASGASIAARRGAHEREPAHV